MSVWWYLYTRAVFSCVATFSEIHELTAESHTWGVCVCLYVYVCFVPWCVIVAAEIKDHLSVWYSRHTYLLELPNWQNDNWSQFLLVTFHSLFPSIHSLPISVLSHPASDQQQSYTLLWPLRTHRNLIFLQTRQLGPWESDPLLDPSQDQQWHFRISATQIPASLVPQRAQGHHLTRC